MRTNEETFFLEDAQHQHGTNRYTFTFPPHWRRTNQKSLSIAIRSVKRIDAPESVEPILTLNLQLKNITFYVVFPAGETRPTEELSIDISSGEFTTNNCEPMNQNLNKALQALLDAYVGPPETLLKTAEIYFKYDIETEKLMLGFVQTFVPHNIWWFFPDENSTDIFNDDVKTFLNISEIEFFHGLVSEMNDMSSDGQAFNVRWAKYNVKLVKKNYMGISDKWATTYLEIPRAKIIETTPTELAVSASFVDMNERKWLGITNEQFIPPKEYPITYDDQKFWIELHTLDGRPAEINRAKGETLVIEAMMNSYL